MFCSFDIYQAGDGNTVKESRRQVTHPGHTGSIYELSLAEGIRLGYYNIESTQPGKVVIRNTHSFIQLSYTISGNKNYRTDNGRRPLQAFKKREYNYLFLIRDHIHLNWDPGERLEIFELGISPELMLGYLPLEHPFYEALHRGIERNEPVVMSGVNLFLQQESNHILYKMLNCPLAGRYQQLYIKAKLLELLTLELEAFEQSSLQSRAKAHKPSRIRPIDIERMHQARNIIVSNLQSPCSLIDLAHQVGTNDAYLKKHFKEVFGTTVFGYLHFTKMNEAKNLLERSVSISEVAYLTGYKHVAHFTRAFKKHFGFPPGTMKK